jgi:CRISPR/Cas system-associated exonuclease Cas4 (RecB family)
VELHVDELHAYLNCPLKHQFIHVNKLEVEKEKGVLFKEAVHKTISSFYFSLMGERLMTPKQMKDKWASVWGEMQGEKQSVDELLFGSTTGKAKKNPNDRYNIQGFEMVHNFHHFNKDNPGIPIAVDLEYRVPIGGVTLVGKFELIREKVDKINQTRFIEIVDFKTGNEQTDPFLVNTDINLTIASYAFRNLFQSKEDRLTYHYLKTGKEIYTQRTDNDYKRLEAIVTGVAKGIKDKHFYPRQSFMCKSCELKDICERTRF